MSSSEPTFRAAPIRAWRCVRHPEREAAAKCPVCGQPFCRECVIEHEGRFLCAGCLAKEGTPKPVEKPRRSLAVLRERLLLLVAGGVLWFVFFYSETLLGRIPQDFHDATFWKEQGAPPAEGPQRGER